MDVPVQYYFIALSMVVGFLTYTRNKAVYLKIFPFFLMLTLTTEILGWQMSVYDQNNSALYNYFSLAAFTYYMYIIRYAVVHPVAKKVIQWIITIYVAATLIYINFILGPIFHTVTYTIGCCLVVLLSMYYFYELFQAPRSINLLREPAFWIVVGLLFFYTCTLPILGMLNYYPEVFLISEPIIMILNILLYSLFTIAFLCRIRYKRSIS